MAFRPQPPRGGPPQQRLPFRGPPQQQQQHRGPPQHQQHPRGGQQVGSRMPPMQPRQRPGYKPVEADYIRHRAESRGGDFDGPFLPKYDVFIPKSGQNTIRYLPPLGWDSPGNYYGMLITVHKYVGPDKGTYLCRRKMLNEPCALCDVTATFQAEGDKVGVQQWRGKDEMVYWILDRADPVKKPRLYRMSARQDSEVADICIDKQTNGVLQVADPYAGFDLSFNRTQLGAELITTRYTSWAVARDTTPLCRDPRDLELALDYVEQNPLPSVLRFFDNDYLQNIAYGTAEHDDPDLGDGAYDQGQDGAYDNQGQDNYNNQNTDTGYVDNAGGYEREDQYGPGTGDDGYGSETAEAANYQSNDPNGAPYGEDAGGQDGYTDQGQFDQNAPWQAHQGEFDENNQGGEAGSQEETQPRPRGRPGGSQQRLPVTAQRPPPGRRAAPDQYYEDQPQGGGQTQDQPQNERPARRAAPPQTQQPKGGGRPPQRGGSKPAPRGGGRVKPAPRKR